MPADLFLSWFYQEYYLVAKKLIIYCIIIANAKLAVEKIKDPTYMGVFNGMLAVDSFFFIRLVLLLWQQLCSCIYYLLKTANNTAKQITFV